MEGILRCSTLNPLATCFVPSNMRKAIWPDNKICKVKDKDLKKKARKQNSNSIFKFKTKLGFKNNIKKIDILVNCSTLSEILDLTQQTVKILNENFYFSEKFVDSEHSKCIVPSNSQWPVDLTCFLKLLLALFGVSPINYKSNVYALELSQNETDLKVSSKTEEKCSCPPMFGCIVPPDFFGNPFNLSSSCSKKNLHICHYPEGNESSVFSNIQSDSWPQTAIETMECSDDFITDTHQGIQSISKSNVSGNFEIEGPISFNTGFKKDKRHDSTALNSMDLDNLPANNEMPKDTELLDDNFHPLLDEGICMDEDEGRFNEMEKLSEAKRNFASLLQSYSFDPGLSSCDPPCSVWCDSLPQSAKETSRKFLKCLPQSDQDPWSSTKLGQSERLSSTLHESFYDRTLSPYLFENECFQGGFELNRPLLTKTSKQKYKMNQTLYSTKHYKHASIMNLPYKVLNRSDSHKSMWGVFDGEDSLWQALPDCSSFSKSPKRFSLQ